MEYVSINSLFINASVILAGAVLPVTSTSTNVLNHLVKMADNVLMVLTISTVFARLVILARHVSTLLMTALPTRARTVHLALIKLTDSSANAVQDT